MPEQTSCTPEGGLEALAEALFTLYRYRIPCQGEGRHVPLTKDQAGRKDNNGRLYRYWTCTRCQPRTKRNCRSYISEAERVLGREVVDDLASTVLDERRLTLKPYVLLDAWLRRTLSDSTTPVSSRSQKKRKSILVDDDVDDTTSIKRSRVSCEPDISTGTFTGGGTTDGSDAAALKAAYAAREAIDRLIATLTDSRPPPIATPIASPIVSPIVSPIARSIANPVTPTPATRPVFESLSLAESDGDEVILLPNPPSRTPLAPLTTNVPNPSNPQPSASVLQSLVARFRQAKDANARNAARKEAKRLGLSARFEAERSKEAKSTTA